MPLSSAMNTIVMVDRHEDGVVLVFVRYIWFMMWWRRMCPRPDSLGLDGRKHDG
jgi:hypothetical protein